VVAERDDVGAGREQLVGVARRDADAARGVLAVDHDEVGVQLRAQVAQHAAYGAPAGGADHVADEQDRGQGRHGSRPPRRGAY
jgi:hypothetical protein